MNDAEARLRVVLAEVVESTEMLMLSGLTSVSPTITNTFQNAFEHAAKCQQLRLSSNLRLVNQELKRFFADDDRFSEKRLALFLNRCWQMSRQFARVDNDGTDPPEAKTIEVAELKVAIQGVIKKTVPGLFCALEFRLRATDEVISKPLLWSCVLATPENSRITPESLLGLDQPQNFKPDIFLNSTVSLRNIGLQEDDTVVRIQLDKASEVLADDLPLASIESPQGKSLASVVESLKLREPTPLDLETQPQYEVYLDNWRIEPEFAHPALENAFENKVLFPLYSNTKQLFMVIDDNDDGRGQLDYFRSRVSAAGNDESDLLFGLLHCEQGICLFQPLTLWPADQLPVHLMITEDQSDYAALLKILN